MSTDKTNSGKTLFQKIYIVIATVLAVANVLARLCHHLVAPRYCEIDVVYEWLIANVIFLAIAFLIYSLKLKERFRNTVYVLSILLLAPFLLGLFIEISMIPNNRKNQAHWDYWQEVEKNTAAALEEENVEQETTYTPTQTKPSPGRTATTPPRQTSGEDNTDYTEIFKRGVDAYNAKDYITAYECFSYLAEKGEPKAQQILSLMYAKGLGVTADYEKSLEMLKKAADNGLAEAQCCLGVLYQGGIKVDVDIEKAFELYEKAANQGHLKAQGHLASMYYEGYGVAKDYDKAFQLAEKAANKGDATAQAYLALMYYNGHGVEKNLDKALEWAEKAEKDTLLGEMIVKKIKEKR